MLWSPGDSARPKLLLGQAGVTLCRQDRTAHRHRHACIPQLAPELPDVAAAAPSPVMSLRYHLLSHCFSSCCHAAAADSQETGVLLRLRVPHRWLWTVDPLGVDTALPAGDAGGAAAWCGPCLHQSAQISATWCKAVGGMCRWTAAWRSVGRSARR